MTRIKIALAATAFFGLSSGAAMSMPLNNLTTVDTGVKAESVRWVCNEWGRCWWRPNYYGGYAYYGSRPYRGWRHRYYR
jgi:hypothetical protein